MEEALSRVCLSFFSRASAIITYILQELVLEEDRFLRKFLRDPLLPVPNVGHCMPVMEEPQQGNRLSGWLFLNYFVHRSNQEI